MGRPAAGELWAGKAAEPKWLRRMVLVLVLCVLVLMLLLFKTGIPSFTNITITITNTNLFGIFRREKMPANELEQSQSHEAWVSSSSKNMPADELE